MTGRSLPDPEVRRIPPGPDLVTLVLLLWLVAESSIGAAEALGRVYADDAVHLAGLSASLLARASAVVLWVEFRQVRTFVVALARLSIGVLSSFALVATVIAATRDPGPTQRFSIVLLHVAPCLAFLALIDWAVGREPRDGMQLTTRTSARGHRTSR